MTADIDEETFSPDLPVTVQKDKPRTFIREYLMESRNREVEEPKAGKRRNPRRRRPRRRKCMTCAPRPFARDLVIADPGTVIFSHDTRNRDMVIASPRDHFCNLTEISPERAGEFFAEVTAFCEDWGIAEYTVEFSRSPRTEDSHFHAKIRTPRAKAMRDDHFRLRKLRKDRLEARQNSS